MEKIHNLTDKEIKALADASSLIKKLTKYVEHVNTTNIWLERNLDERIKAGDVTNAQKIALRCAEDVDKLYAVTLKNIKEECEKLNPGCKCEEDKHHGCLLYQKFIVASWMHDAAKGQDFAWNTILEYALVGRKEWIKKYYPNKENQKWK